MSAPFDDSLRCSRLLVWQPLTDGHLRHVGTLLCPRAHSGERCGRLIETRQCVDPSGNDVADGTCHRVGRCFKWTPLLERAARLTMKLIHRHGCGLVYLQLGRTALRVTASTNMP